VAVAHDGAATDDFYCDRVLNGAEPVDVVFEDEDVLAFHHTRPYFADAHVVVVPKQHIPSLLSPEADEVLPALLAAVRRVASDVLAAHGAARVLTNLGAYQDSKHLHWHVCAGETTR
jgi:histidine triad (HIT) family protein